ncbi:MAG: peptide chain release factor N(5)-glutamine methyltransferase [Minisyncoccia bacterium]
MKDRTDEKFNKYGREIRWIVNEKYKGRKEKLTKTDLSRLQTGEPVGYIIGFADFLGCKIDLTKRPLIPRPETEFWVEKAIKEMNKSKTPKMCLDMFSGSGCVGILVLKNCPNVKMDFSDSEMAMIMQIKINCKQNKVNNSKIRTIKSDIFENIVDKYDYIFANPPYISENKKSEVEKSVLDFEPNNALFGGSDGLLYIKKFLEQAEKHLNKGGKIYMEFGYNQKGDVSRILKDNSFTQTQFYKDQFGKWRYLVAII